MKRIIIVSLSLLSFSAISQNLEKKWDQMLSKSYSYKSHKVIKETELAQMWTSIEDTMALAKNKWANEQKKVNAQQVEMATLKRKTIEAQRILAEETKEKDKAIESRAAVGIYIFSLWFALGAAVLAGAFLFFLYKRSNTITEKKTVEHEELMRSFDEYRAQKLEIERKLKRELQTYLNQSHEPKRM